MSFLDRTREIEVLQRAWDSGQAELVVLYGRRRVGKSALLTHFFQDKPLVYYASTRKVTRDQLAELTDQIRRFTGDPFLERQPLGSWDALFVYLGEGWQAVGWRWCWTSSSTWCRAIPPCPR